MQNVNGLWPSHPQQQVNDPSLHHLPKHSSPFQGHDQLNVRPSLQPPIQQHSPNQLHPGAFVQQHAQPPQPLPDHHPMQAPIQVAPNGSSMHHPLPQYGQPNSRARPPPLQGPTMESDILIDGQASASREVFISDRGKTSEDKQRIRVNRACERCRIHKIKCTGLHPCVNCSKHGIECVIRTAKTDTASKKRRPDDDESTASPPAKLVENFAIDYSSAPTEEYVAKNDAIVSNAPTPANASNNNAYTRYLESRVQYLENLLAKKTAGPDSSHPEDVPLKDTMDILTPTSTKWKVSRRVHSALAIQLCSSLYESLPEEARSGVNVPRTNHYGWNMSGCNYAKPMSLPPVPDTSGICPQRQMDCLDFFFRELNPIYAILHEPVFREQFAAFQKLENDDEASSDKTALFRAMIFLVYATSIRFNEFMKPNGPNMAMLHLEEALYNYSIRTLQLFTKEWESFELIQCWLLATLYLRITHRQTSCFYALGNAVNMCRGMGLGKYESIIPHIKPYIKLKAERIFFSVYIFDRVIGLQGGRFRSLSDSEVNRAFPSLEDISDTCQDGWSTLPALAMLHIARLSNYMEIFVSNDGDRRKAEVIEKEFSAFEAFLERAGFNNMDNMDNTKLHLGNLPSVTPMVKAQIRLHYYELVMSVHGKGLFSYFGQKVSIEGINVERVYEANINVIATFKKMEELNYLNAPWYLTLTSLLSVGITSLVFMHVRKHLRESKMLLNESIAMLQKLKNTPVRDDGGKLIFRQRFKMVEECIWLIKMINHLMILTFEQSIKSLSELGTDHGSSEVNKRRFSQFGWEGSQSAGADKLMNQQSPQCRAIDNGSNIQPYAMTMDSSPESCISQPKSNTVTIENFLENIAWFEQWIDSDQNI